MIILLTGKPGVGKTTALKEFIKLYEQPAHWIITSRIPNPSGDGGLGFIATSSRGQTQIVSHKTDIQSDIVVGRNHVDVAAVEKMFLPILQDALTQTGALAVIDEIGPIEMASATFESLLPEVLDPNNDLVAIIHLEEKRLERYRQSAQNVLLHVTLENRTMLPYALLVMTQHRKQFNVLNNNQRAVVISLIQGYVARAQLLQLEKLMKNAISYVDAGKISKIKPGTWTVEGRHGDHVVMFEEKGYRCDCDVFNGRGEYGNRAGECSHIQAVKIVETTPSLG